MSDLSRPVADFPRWQQSIRNRCVHSTGTFIKFEKGETEQSIPDRFEQMVRMYPDRLAVKTRRHALTYDALNRLANRVARAILARRGGREEPVALLYEQGAPLIISILGILKAGKIYVPLDPSLPYSRTVYLLEDSQAGLIVTNNQNFLLAHELAQNGSELMNSDGLDSSIPTDNLRLSISSDTLTWIIHTSGSTGQPKGVVQNHRNVLHFVMNYTNSFHICADDRLTNLFSPSANAGAHDTVAALLNGAGLYLLNLKEEGLAHMAEWLIREEITIYKSAATVFRHFLTTLTGEEEFPRLRLVYLGGEPVYKRDVERYKKLFSQSCIFANRLGSTETGSIRMYFVDKETHIDGNMVPVGYPVEDNEILLLDDDGEEVGSDEIGEIAVRSRYLSPGYWHKPDLTRAAFMSDPEGGDQRIYRTGDLGCMSSGGCLVHLGRKDSQVKISGYRIEVDEIEMALLELAEIKETVVVAREDVPGDPTAPLRTGQRLVAYLVPNRQPAPTVSELRRLLAERLPDYMIPSAFVTLDALPLAPNGKVDRQRLPAPGRARPELEAAYVAPRTHLEEVLARIWREVLNLDQIGIHDNFLELGGSSLQATQVISRVLKAFRVELSLRSLFRAPTVAEMALSVQNQAAQKDSHLDVINRINRGNQEQLLARVDQLSDQEVESLFKAMLADEEISK